MGLSLCSHHMLFDPMVNIKILIIAALKCNSLCGCIGFWSVEATAGGEMSTSASSV